MGFDFCGTGAENEATNWESGEEFGTPTRMTYQVIARKWRPQTFADLVGQEHVTETLANAIKKDRVAHAYIFSGARGVGKTTAARILAKALNCVNGPTAEPCGVCDSCKEIAAGSSLDVIEIDAASNRGIDQIRELREMVRYAPAASRSKVVILDEAHMLTGEASNALLKTLEEPPDRVIFVMATTQPEDLEDTIRSRSQHFHFRALTFNEITDRLKYIASKENLKIEDGALAVIARMAEGSMRDALSLLEQARAYCGDDIQDQAVRDLLGVVPEDALNELVQAIAEQSAERALGLVHRFQKEGRNLQHFCREAIRHMRNLLIARVCGADSDLLAATPDQRPGLAKAAALFSEEDLTRYFQILLQTDDSLRRAMDSRVHLEMGLLRLVNAARLAPLEELLAEAKSVGGNGPAGGSASRTAGSGTATPSFPSRSATAGAASFSNVTNVIEQQAPASEGGRYKIEERVPSAFGVSGTGIAAAPALEPAEKSAQPGMAVPPVTAAPTVKLKTAEVSSAGLEAGQVAEIKAGIAEQQKFIGELLEHSSRWELDGMELRIYFPAEKSTFAGLIEGRDTLEKIRSVSGKVLGRAVRVCAKLETGAAKDANASRAASSTQEIRAQFENDPMVKSMLQRFGGRISEVRRQGEE
ncbi:MAG TPA: DNA polymerase III subunit gamma/tau [Candidatus Limnocylindrales bacterium]|nr:DNA polymerase III subunit gamma/tau [Candidatus Limnocylindrales bacterium]